MMKSNYSNTAQLKELMTAPPMSAARHAELPSAACWKKRAI
jgi:hypothetical protein